MSTELRLSALNRALDYATEGCTCDPDVTVSGVMVEVNHQSGCSRVIDGAGIVALRAPR